MVAVNWWVHSDVVIVVNSVINNGGCMLMCMIMFMLIGIQGDGESEVSLM